MDNAKWRYISVNFLKFCSTMLYMGEWKCVVKLLQQWFYFIISTFFFGSLNGYLQFLSALMSLAGLKSLLLIILYTFEVCFCISEEVEASLNDGEQSLSFTVELRVSRVGFFSCSKTSCKAKSHKTNQNVSLG